MSERLPPDKRKEMCLPTLPEREGGRTVTGQWARGTSGNPAGRPRGARNKLSEDIITAFSADFTQHGPDVIARVRVEHPEQHLAIVARLVPREFQVREERAFEELSDDDLEALIVAVRGVK
jgi:uncharacterized protein DUF5681